MTDCTQSPAVSAHDRAIDPALQRFMAERAGSTTVQFAAASHVGGLTHYRSSGNSWTNLPVQ